MISIRNLEFHYSKQLPLFNQFTLTVKPGTITGLLGKNGSGKTSLLKLINGLIYPDSGNLEVLGIAPMSRRPSLLENIFFVPEEFYLPPITLQKYVAANHKFYRSFDFDLLNNLLRECELSDDQVIQELSFGQKKKFLITFALATKCRIILLDEPTNGLDIPSKTIFRKIVAGSLDKEQIVLIATHQVKDIETLIDRLIILDKGGVIMHKDLHEISSRLQFARRTTLEGSDIIYSEISPGGYKVVCPQVNGDSSIDMELLFNAATSGLQIFDENEN